MRPWSIIYLIISLYLRYIYDIPHLAKRSLKTHMDYSSLNLVLNLLLQGKSDMTA